MTTRSEAAIRAARAVHPGLAVSDEQFAEFLARRLDAGQLDDDAALRNAGDLLSVCAVLAGDTGAIAMLDRTVIATLRGSLSRLVGDAAVDEVKQRVRETLFVAKPGIADYAGRGPLRAWVRAVALRIAIKMRNEHAWIDELDFDVVDPDDDPALTVLRGQYAAEFRRAFEVALRSLKPRDRTLLRQQFVDGLGTEALADLHRVHRVTMYRRLGKIRHRVLSTLRRDLARRIVLQSSELDSILRVIDGNIELTLERVLASTPP